MNLMNIWKRIANNPVLVIAAITAGLNAATVRTWQGYAAAGLTALVRWVVTGPFTPSKETP